jgi:hypothetical protein
VKVGGVIFRFVGLHNQFSACTYIKTQNADDANCPVSQ